MTDLVSDIPISFWLSVGLAAAFTISSLVLSLQRLYYERQQKITNEHLKIDSVRDVINQPFSNGNRMSRIIFENLLLIVLSGYLFVTQVRHFSGKENTDHVAVYTVVGSGIQFITFIYSFFLACTASRYPLPNQLGWRLNVHLCVLYAASVLPASYNLIVALWDDPTISFTHALPLALLVLLILDLVYTTGTVSDGSPFLDENGKTVNGSEVSSIFGSLYFSWITPIIKLVNARGSELVDEDLPILPSTHRAYNMFYVFGRNRGSKLLYRIYMGSRYSINTQATLSVIMPVLYYATPYFLNKLLLVIQDITSGRADNWSYTLGFCYVLGMAVFIIIYNLLTAQLWYHGQSNVQLRIKSMLNLEIYRKTLRGMDTSVISNGKGKSKEDIINKNKQKSSAVDEDEVSSMTGTIVNLMSTDSTRIAGFSSWWFVSIVCPLELIFGITFLYSFLGWSCFVGLTAMVVMLPVNHYNSKLFVKKQKQLMTSRDKRVSLMNEVLQGIRQIKFFAWEKNWTERITNAREVELGHMRVVYSLICYLWSYGMVTTLAFWSFTKLQGQEPTAPIAFTSISVFNQLRESLTVLPEVFIRALETLISVNRIEKYLNEEEIKQSVDPKVSSNVNPVRDEEIIEEIKIGFENATIGWPTFTPEEKIPKVVVSGEENTVINSDLETISDSTAEEDDNSFSVRDINLQFPNDNLSLICGATGSGKTLLMLSLLGETEIKKGKAYCPRVASTSTLDNSTTITSIKVLEDADVIPNDWILRHAVAYSSQTPWLRNDSIKNNILFGLPFAQKRYKATLFACALEKDLSYLDDGDQTEIGEKGITLSGGQKARVALARAVYSRAQNVLMDDVLSAVDAHTANHLYKQCLLGPLMKGRTQILITHHVNLCIEGSAYIVFVKDGQVKLTGSPSELKQAGQLSLIFKENIKSETSEEEEAALVVEDQLSEEPAEEEEVKKPKALVEIEARAIGSVKMKLYKLYFGLLGSWIFWLFVFVTIFTAKGLDVTSSWWIKEWSQSYEQSFPGNNTPTNIYTSLHALESPIQPTSYQLPASVPSFFANFAPTGNTVLLDEEKPSKLNMYLGIYVLINISHITIIVIRYGAVFAGGIRASRKLYVMLLDRVFHAPLRFFDATPVGRIVNRFAKDFETIDSSVPTNILQFLIQWTTVISIVCVATFVFPALIVLMISVVGINVYFALKFVSASRELKRMDSVSRSPIFTHFSETIVGVTTIRAFGMTQQFMLDMIHKVDVNARPMYYAWTVSRWVSTRIAVMGSLVSLVTGVFILMNLDLIDAATAGFCLSYVLSFTNMIYWGVRRYTELEMDFNAVERVVEYLSIDQEAAAITDVRTPEDWPSQGAIEVKDLKVRYAPDLEPVLKGLTFSIKPQEKIGIVGRTGSGKSTLALAFFRFIELCEGSITIDDIDISDIGTEDLRSNLTIIPQDPVLFSGTLQSNMDPFNQFSEEDIFTALRRVHLLTDAEDENNNENVLKTCNHLALLKSSRVVLMDEATASVDFETDTAIQKTITTEFSKSTILCIAHRLNTIIEYDRILVLDYGQVVEFDSPLELLHNSKSLFYKMCRNSGDFERLLTLAKAKHELVDVS
ncbi:unnamed protein product [Mucor hiemalis]